MSDDPSAAGVVEDAPAPARAAKPARKKQTTKSAEEVAAVVDAVSADVEGDSLAKAAEAAKEGETTAAAAPPAMPMFAPNPGMAAMGSAMPDVVRRMLAGQANTDDADAASPPAGTRSSTRPAGSVAMPGMVPDAIRLGKAAADAAGARASRKVDGFVEVASAPAPSPAPVSVAPPVPSPAPAAAAAPAKAAPPAVGKEAAGKHTYAELKVPGSTLTTPDIDPSVREAYLSDAEFRTVLEMDRDAFQKLAKWKRDGIKKAKGLF
eukprot:TRINITY_DN47138_c0_g1_i1.p1 TRINITY_DN47138_c0_g1~~TRINITY_DN47138_c0_g1_i1.p1  ORF type:complete len:264 (-),score=45.22 TRINITY_DN47138_c0_g1_i1:208-999(-)